MTKKAVFYKPLTPVSVTHLVQNWNAGTYIGQKDDAESADCQLRSDLSSEALFYGILSAQGVTFLVGVGQFTRYLASLSRWCAKRQAQPDLPTR
jgi:hypothetical protein